MLYRTN